MIHLEYIDDLILRFQPQPGKLIMPVLEIALSSMNLRLNHRKSKVLIPVAVAGDVHPIIAELGLPQVFGGMELLGGAMEGEVGMEAPSLSTVVVPLAFMK